MRWWSVPLPPPTHTHTHHHHPTQATDHARQLVEKYVGKPFFDLPYARGVRRMSERELDEGLDWIDDRFHLVRSVVERWGGEWEREWEWEWDGMGMG